MTTSKGRRSKSRRRRRLPHWLTPNLARLGVAALVALVAGPLFGWMGGWELGLVGGWSMFCLIYVVSVWASVWRFDAERTRTHALREDPARAIADAMIILASVTSLSAIVLLLAKSAEETTYKAIASGTALGSVILSWLLIHTVYTLRYAREYYRSPQGGIDFNGETKPRYSDFAYFSFNLGMTFQISDTSISTNRLRRMVLWHTMLSYLFNTVIVATMVNLIVGFASGG